MSDHTHSQHVAGCYRCDRPLRYAALTALCLYALIVLLALGEEAALRILTGLDVEYDAGEVE